MKHDPPLSPRERQDWTFVSFVFWFGFFAGAILGVIGTLVVVGYWRLY